MADGGLGCSQGGGSRRNTPTGRGVRGVGAHREAEEMVSELGDDLETVNRSRRSSVPVGEDDDDGVTAGLPASCVLTETMYATSAEFPDKWGGEGRPVGMAAVSCTLRMCSGGCERESRSGGERPERRGSGRGGAWRLQARIGPKGRPARSRRWRLGHGRVDTPLPVGRG